MYFLKRGWILLTLTAFSYAFDVCTEYGDFHTKTLTCRDLCCGSRSFKYCCSTRRLSAKSIGVVVTCVVFVIALIVGALYCCRLYQGPRGRVVTTNQQLAVVQTGTNPTGAAYNAGYIYPPQPAPGTYCPQPAGTEQPPPPYFHRPGPVYAPTTGEAFSPFTLSETNSETKALTTSGQV
ncbi:uncharacterized protein [Haliotis cracherodii]|uniref:uncharacterized protein n=1 Tax=Haliotis cracherodii TaxID=6455 RepID=UPI0039E9B2FE